MSLEDNHIRIIEGAIRGIKMGTKKPQDVAHISKNFEALKKLNEGMAEDLMNNYKAVLVEYNKKNPKK